MSALPLELTLHSAYRKNPRECAAREVCEAATSASRERILAQYGPLGLLLQPDAHLYLIIECNSVLTRSRTHIHWISSHLSCHVEYGAFTRAEEVWEGPSGHALGDGKQLARGEPSTTLPTSPNNRQSSALRLACVFSDSPAGAAQDYCPFSALRGDRFGAPRAEPLD